MRHSEFVVKHPQAADAEVPVVLRGLSYRDLMTLSLNLHAANLHGDPIPAVANAQRQIDAAAARHRDAHDVDPSFQDEPEETVVMPERVIHNDIAERERRRAWAAKSREEG